MRRLIAPVALLTGTTIIGGSLLAEAAPTSTQYLNPPAEVSVPRARVYADALIEDINALRKGDTIRLAAFLLDDQATINALIAAHNRGGNVRIVLDSVAAGFPSTKAAGQRLAAVLGTDRTDRSWITRPKGSGLSHNPRASMHAKFATITRPGQPPVAWWGSGNPSGGNIRGSWNQATRVVDDPRIFAALNRYHRDLAAGRARNGYAWSAKSGVRTLHFSPGGKNVVRLDLAKVKCTPQTTVLVSMHMWGPSRALDARQLRGMYGAGCNVRVILDPHRVDPGIVRILLTPIHGRTIPVRGFRTTGAYNHLKTVYVQSPAGVRVWKGSQNWTSKALDYNADIVELDRSVTRARPYRAFLEEQWSKSKPISSVTQASSSSSETDRDE